MSIFLEKLTHNHDITIFGGEQTRDFVYVTDVANIIIDAIRLSSSRRISETVNVLTGRSVSINWLAENLIKITKSRSGKIFQDLALGDPTESNGTTAKLLRILKKAPSDFINLEKGLNLILKDNKQRPQRNE